MNRRRWTEALEGDGSSLEIVVDAVDADRSERREIESFRRALSAPAAEHGTIVKDAEGRVRPSSVDMLRVVRGVVRLTVAFVVCVALLAALAEVAALKLTGSAWLTIFLIALFGPLAVSAIRHLQRRQNLEKVRDRFTLTLDAAGFRLRGSASSGTTALEAIERFEGETRLVLLSTEGRRDVLPVALGSPVDHVALADRLNEALVQVRASRGGYRGAGPRVELRSPPVEPPDAESLESPQESERRKGGLASANPFSRPDRPTY